MEWVDKIGSIAFKSLKFLPCFFTAVQYFTVLTKEQRTQPIGWAFLFFSIGYFIVALILLVMNWKI